MRELQELIPGRQEWLVKRTEEIAKEHGWGHDLLTWETVCRGLSHALLKALEQGFLEEGASRKDKAAWDQLSAFVCEEVRRHRSRGVPFPPFLSALKCCRMAFLDLAREHSNLSSRMEIHILLNRFFDWVDLAVTSEWVSIGKDQLLQELQEKNRSLTGEKNTSLTMLESIPNPIFLLDNKQALQWMNPAARRLFLKHGETGTRDAREGLSWLTSLADEFAGAGGEEVQFELEIDTPLGPRHFQVNLRKAADREAKVPGTTVILNDITDYRKALEEASRYRILARRATDIILFMVPENGQILEANEAALGAFGYTRRELLTKTVYDLSDPSVHSSIAQRLGVRRERELVFESLMRRRDGTVFPAEVTSELAMVGDEQMIVNIIRDISDRKQAEIRLREAYTELDQVFRAAADGMWVIGTDHRVLRLNQRLAEMLGVDPAAAVGRKCHELLHGRDCRTGDCPLCCLGKGKGRLEREVEVKWDGGSSWFLISAAALLDADSKLTGVVESLKDITERKRAEEAIRYLSFHDTLTGLYNRAYFEERLKDVHHMSLPCSIILGDLNGLKIVNDAFGHAKGDQFLVETAKILKNACRGEDVVARWGGDEFAILLPGAGEQDALSVVARIRQACAESRMEPIPPTIAMGVGTKSSRCPDVYQVLKEAEAGMYRRKLLESDSARSFSIQSLQRSLQEKSVETEEHAQRLRALAGHLASSLNLPLNQVDELKILATLHDIGKIAIPDDILNKPGSLMPEEWEIMERHPEIGYRIARASPELVPIAEGILAHHERWDGKGYPRGLAGERIPLVARILAVIDAFDAMTHDRLYRRAIPVEDALEELKNNAGTQFDPMVVKVFVASAGKLHGLLESGGPDRFDAVKMT